MREFPFTLRWNDIRRCNFNTDPNDDVTITRNFYNIDQYSVDTGNIKTYTLPHNHGDMQSLYPMRILYR